VVWRVSIVRSVAKYVSVILLEQMDELGRKGEEIKVRHGHARNLLLPTKKAVLATAETRAKFRIELSEEDEEALRRIRERNLLKRLVEAVVLDFSQRTIDGSTLYGSVSTQDIASAMKTSSASVEVPSSYIHLVKKVSSNPYYDEDDPEAVADDVGEQPDLSRGIKSVGVFEAAVQAAEDMWCSVKVRVHPA